LVNQNIFNYTLHCTCLSSHMRVYHIHSIISWYYISWKGKLVTNTGVTCLVYGAFAVCEKFKDRLNSMCYIMYKNGPHGNPVDTITLSHDLKIWILNGFYKTWHARLLHGSEQSSYTKRIILKW